MLSPGLLWLGWFFTSSPASSRLLVQHAGRWAVATCTTDQTMTCWRRYCVTEDEALLRAWFDEDRDARWDLRGRDFSEDGVPRACERRSAHGWTAVEAAECRKALTKRCP